jgi:hypothetical protein
MGTPEDQTTQFPPHKVGNIYYVGTKTLSSFLIVTRQAISSSTAPTAERPNDREVGHRSGVRFSDIQILLGTTRTAITRKATPW